VSVIDEVTSTVTASIPVGSNPDGVAVDPAAHTAYVPNFFGNSVSVISRCM
jgi:DNA-binding beta-propeller fold protein YncE